MFAGSVLFAPLYHLLPSAVGRPSAGGLASAADKGNRNTGDAGV